MATAIPRAGLEKRLEELLAQRVRLDGHIEEVGFWLSQCDDFEAAVQLEVEDFSATSEEQAEPA
jgi:hypothetical protein